MLAAARLVGVQVVWELRNYGLPADPELKRRLAQAIAAIDAVRDVCPTTRFIKAEPLFHVAGDSDLPQTGLGAVDHRLAQFQEFDMIAGRNAPELGGIEDHLDIVFVNYYPENQILRTGGINPVRAPGAHHAREWECDRWGLWG